MSLFSGMMRVFIGVILLTFTPISASAATNPISYTLTPSGGLPSTVITGNAYVLRYTFTNSLPFKEPIKQIVSNTNTPGFTVNDNCSGRTLNPSGGSCNVDIIFIPSVAGNANQQLILSYDKNVVPLPVVSTTVPANANNQISGAVTNALPVDSTVNTGYSVEFTYTNNGSSNVTANNVGYSGNTGNFTNIVNGCTGTLLKHGHSCTVTGTYTPSAAGAQSIGAVYYYNNNANQVALTTSTIASSGGGGCGSLTATTNLMLPTSTFQYADNVMKVTFKNECDSASTTLGTVNWSATLGSSSITKNNKGIKQLNGATNVSSWIITQTSTDNCSNQTLAPNTSCTVIAAVRPQTTGSNLIVNAVVPYSSTSGNKQATASSTASTIQANDSNNRMITVVNQCSVPVWMTFVAAAVPSSPSCPTTACPTGSTCNTTNHICYFTNPSLDGNHTYGEMQKAIANVPPDTMNISVSEDYSGTSPTANTLYNAGIAPRLGCTATGVSTNPVSCTVNNCGSTVGTLPNTTGPDGMCAAGVGPSTYPAITFNAVEFTFIRNLSPPGTTDGVYDEQTIQGVTVPMEMVGRGPASTGTLPYQNCPPSGGPVQATASTAANQLGNCTYNYSTPAPGTYRPSNYIFVTGDGTSCDTSDSQCNSDPGTVCGLAYNGTNVVKQCGQLQGYISVNINICSQTVAFSGTAAGLQTLYNCATDYPNPTPPGPTYSTGTQLYACSGTYTGQSCYNPDLSNPVNSCCGCVDWWNVSGVNVPSNTVSCTQNGITYSNPSWTTAGGGIVQPQIQWMKQACPTAYSYQYDDKSSSFFCTVPDSTGTKIVTNYQVTFCPGGNEVSKIQS